MDLPESLRARFDQLRAKLARASTPLSWRERVRICMPQAKVRPPATEKEIAAAEVALNSKFPSDLRDLLLEMDGIDGLYSDPVCSVQQIVSMNREYRTADYLADFLPLDDLLFFGDTGNGDDFAFPVSQSDEPRAVLMRDHEEDSRDEYAGGLSDFLVRYSLEFYSLRAK